MAEPATRESYTPSHNAASDALCMLHTLAMIRKITEGEERRGVDRLSSCTNDRDAVSTTLRVVPALQIDCVAKKRAWNRPRGSIRSAPRCTSTVPRTFQPARMQAMQLVSRLVPCFFFFSFPLSPSFPEWRTPDSARVCKENTVRGHARLDRLFFRTWVFPRHPFLIAFHGPRWFENTRPPAENEIKREISTVACLNARLIFRESTVRGTDLFHGPINASRTERKHLENGSTINYSVIVWKQSRLIMTIPL